MGDRGCKVYNLVIPGRTWSGRVAARPPPPLRTVSRDKLLRRLGLDAHSCARVPPRVAPGEGGIGAGAEGEWASRTGGEDEVQRGPSFMRAGAGVRETHVAMHAAHRRCECCGPRDGAASWTALQR